MRAGAATFWRYWHTLRHLKWVQFTGRAQHVIKQRLHRAPDVGKAPPLRSRTGAFAVPVARQPSMLGPDAFRFLNHEGAITAAADWNTTAKEKLWLYNLHYFDDLTAENAQMRAGWHDALIKRWIAENPPTAGNGWEPYPSSLRIVNWIKRALNGASPMPGETDSLAVQARHLAGHIEWHLLGNHLLANAKAMAFAAAYFEGSEAALWRETAVRNLREQLAEQVLADGGHFERSPMYHCIIAEDVLDLINLSQAYPSVLAEIEPDLRALAPRMLRWIAAMSHPDGGISFFNDGAFGIAPTPAQLFDYAGRLGLPPVANVNAGLTHLAETGMIRLGDDAQVALLDVAPIGPDYLPGHAHADTLSFEWSVNGERVLVNGGTSVYGTGPQRLAERGTASHNTLSIDGENSSEVWGGFRVARRARVFGLKTSEHSRRLQASASHDGYRRLKGRNIHHRGWEMSAGALVVSDDIQGPFTLATARFHLAPGLTATVAGDGLSGHLTSETGTRIRWATTQPARLETTQWSPEFGRRVDRLSLLVDLKGSSLETRFSIER